MKKWIALFLALALSLLCCPVVLAESDAADEDHRISQAAAPELPALKTVLPESEYTTASAPALEEQTVQWQTVEVDGWVNPLYADVLSVEDLTAHAGKRSLKSIRSYGGVNYEENLHKIAASLRQSMVNRDNTFYFRYACPTEDAPTALDDLLNTLMTWAMEITAFGNEGDYITYQLGGYGPASCSIVSGDGWSYYKMDLPISYYTTAAQEAQVSTKISQVISSLGINENTPQYVKIRKIYDYVIENVKYDYTNLNDDSYTLKYTAYAALHNGTAVCQGYANLIYRLMWECGVPCRICAGAGNGGAHAWNMAALGDVFYYLDATWDSNYYESYQRNPYNYFLIGSTKLSADHTHQMAGNWISFEGYPISAGNYNASALSAEDLLPCTHSDYEMSFTINNPDGSVVFYYTCPLCGCMDSMTAYGFYSEEELRYLNELPLRGEHWFTYVGTGDLTITEDFECPAETVLVSDGPAALKVANGATLITTAGLIWGGPVSVSGAWDCYQESLLSSVLTVEEGGCVTNYGRLICLDNLIVKGELENSNNELLCEKDLTVSGQLRSDVWITAEGTVTGSENIIYSFSPEDDFNGNKAIDSGDLLLLACHVAKIRVLPDVQSKSAQDIVAFARMLIARGVQ